MQRRKTIFKNIVNIFFAVSALTLVISAFMLAVTAIKDYRNIKYWERLSKRKENAPIFTRDDILPEYQDLYDENSDIIGWLTIDGARIDYPVMQTKDDPEYYLRRNFSGEDDNGGTPFADYRCDILPVRSFNIIIYGHYTSGDRLFRRLLEYSYQSYYHKHKFFQFDTLNEHGEYEVVAAFYADAGDFELIGEWEPDLEQAYEFCNYIEVDSREGFEKFVRNIEERKLYETDSVCTIDSHILTLICCAPKEFSGIEENGRFVLIAKQVKSK